MRDYSVKIKKEILRKHSEKVCSAGRKRQITVACMIMIPKVTSKKKEVWGTLDHRSQNVDQTDQS